MQFHGLLNFQESALSRSLRPIIIRYIEEWRHGHGTGIAGQREERSVLEKDARVRLGERRELLEAVLVQDLRAETRLPHALLCAQTSNMVMVQHSVSL